MSRRFDYFSQEERNFLEKCIELIPWDGLTGKEQQLRILLAQELDSHVHVPTFKEIEASIFKDVNDSLTKFAESEAKIESWRDLFSEALKVKERGENG